MFCSNKRTIRRSGLDYFFEQDIQYAVDDSLIQNANTYPYPSKFNNSFNYNTNQDISIENEKEGERRGWVQTELHGRLKRIAGYAPGLDGAWGSYVMDGECMRFLAKWRHTVGE